MMPITMADVVLWKKQEENRVAAEKRWITDTFHYIEGLFNRICPGQVKSDDIGVCLAGDCRVWVVDGGIRIQSNKGGNVLYERSPDGDQALQERLLTELAAVIP